MNLRAQKKIKKKNLNKIKIGSKVKSGIGEKSVKYVQRVQLD